MTRTPTGFERRGETYIHLGTGIEFVLIPGGVGRMGSSMHHASESPGHDVQVSSFLLSRYPVTLDVWRRIMGNAVHPPWSPDRCSIAHLSGEYPVADISAQESDEFCQRTGLELPSEAEWEYACRAGCRDDEVKNLDEQAWYVDNCQDIQPVGRKKPNAFGLYDTLGNVWEWCADTWHETYAGAPTDGAAWLDSTSANRVARGGSVEHFATACMPWSRIPWPKYMHGSCAGLRVKSSLDSRSSAPTGPRPVVIPDGFELLGKKKYALNGVVYDLFWIHHVRTGLELPLLPGGMYNDGSLRQLWDDVQLLFTEGVLVTANGTSHPELLNSLVARGSEVDPVLVAHFLTSNRETRAGAAFWHCELRSERERMTYDLPQAMPSAEVFSAALQEDDEWICSMAALTFTAFGQHCRPFLPALTRLLENSETCAVILNVCQELGRFANHALPEIASVALNHDDPKIRRQALEAITSISKYDSFCEDMSQTAKSAAIPLLVSLTEFQGFPSATAARALVLLGHNTSHFVPTLLAALDADDPKARETAAKTLAHIGPAAGEASLAALHRRATDSDPAVREAIAFALRRMQERDP